MSHFTVIGLGRFGSSVSLELMHLGHTVTGVDMNPKMAEKYIEDLTQTVICDCTDEVALKELDVASSDVVLVAIGGDLGSSILCTLALKNLNVKEIWVKASTKAHHTIISKLGVSRIIHPEEEMGMRVAQAMNYPMVNDFMSLGYGTYVVEVTVKEHLDGQPISALLGQESSSIIPLVVKRQSELFPHLQADFILKQGDVILLCGKIAELKYIAKRLL